MSEKKTIIIAFFILIPALFLPLSCQQVFTYSIYSGLKPDLASMSAGAQVAYAQDLLATGTKEELGAAFTAIAAQLPADLSTADPELVLLAADLAIGSSGIGEAVTSAIDMITAGAGEDSAAQIAELLETITTDNLDEAVTYFKAVESSGEVLTSEQYANAAAAQVFVVAEAAGGIDQVDWTDESNEDLQQALEWAEAGGIDFEALFSGGLPG